MFGDLMCIKRREELRTHDYAILPDGFLTRGRSNRSSWVGPPCGPGHFTKFKPEFRSATGSAPAPGAVFRALAENFVRTEFSVVCARSVRAVYWLRGGVQRRPGRACSPNLNSGWEITAAVEAAPKLRSCFRPAKLLRGFLSDARGPAAVWKHHTKGSFWGHAGCR